MKHDLTLLEEFGEALKPADERPPAEVRHRVMNAMRQRPKAATRPLGTRLAWRIGAPATAAAAIAAGLIAGNMANVAGNAPAPPSGSSSIGTGTPAPAGAGLVLQLAAQHADATAQLDARDDQFLYIESMEVRTQLRGRNADQVQVIGPVRVRTWLSVDGTRDGLVSDAVEGDTRLSGCRNGLRAETIDRPDTTPMVPCTPEPAYRLTPVPTDPDELRAYLYDPEGDQYVWILPPGSDTGGVGIKLSEHQLAFQKLTGVLYQNHSPALQAAALRAAARIPGVEVVRGVRDAAGRTGVAVARTEAGTREELVFDERTYAFLGHNSTVAELDLTGVDVTAPPVGEIDAARIDFNRQRRPGDVIQKWAIQRIGIVDRAGQRP